MKEPPPVLPLLRNASLEPEETAAYVSRPFEAGLTLYIAALERIDDISVYISYVKREEWKQIGWSEEAMFEAAFEAMPGSVKVKGVDHEGWVRFGLTQADGFASAAIAQADFPAKAREWTGSERFTVALMHDRGLCVAATTEDNDRRLSRHVVDMAMAGLTLGDPLQLVPTLLHHDGKRFRVVPVGPWSDKLVELRCEIAGIGQREFIRRFRPAVARYVESSSIGVMYAAYPRWRWPLKFDGVVAHLKVADHPTSLTAVNNIFGSLPRPPGVTMTSIRGKGREEIRAEIPRLAP